MNRLLRILRTKREWRIPKSVRVLIYGAGGSEILCNYIAEPVHVYRHPEDVICVPVAVHALVRRRLSREGYLRSYLEIVHPPVVLTNEDNDLLFYRIKCLFPKIETIAIQNGRRDNFANTPAGGFFQLLRVQRESVGATASQIAVFGNSVVPLYQAALDESQPVHYVVTGSLRNNAVPPTSTETSQRLVYISSMPSMNGDHHPESTRTLCFYDGRSLSFAEFWRVELNLVQAAALYARVNQLKFVVLGKRSPAATEEFRFFERHLDGFPFEFFAAETQASSYLHARSNDVFVASDSTLAYELLGRGYRVAFVAGRLRTLGIDSIRDLDFGFPLDLPQRGAFWTTETSQQEVNRVIDFAATATSTQWEAVARDIREKIMAYDPQNNVFCAMLSSLGVATDGPKWWDAQKIPVN